MQIDGDAEKLKEPDGTLARWHVAQTYPTPDHWKQGFWPTKTFESVGADVRRRILNLRYAIYDMRVLPEFTRDT